MFKKLVVGTDGSPTAEKAVREAAELARSWGSELHIVTAFRILRSGMGAVAGGDLVDSGAGHAMAEEAARAVGLSSIEKFGDGIAAEAHSQPGSADDVILATAAEVGADLIVVGSKGMQGARRYLGSVPNSVAHGAACSVLLVKTV
jgi:nucleotide-binding universal stress UspA family protein